MTTRDPDDSKLKALARAGSLHPHPDRVSDELFRDNLFFDPYDGVQVKYEMLRRVRVDGQSVSQAASSCGLSRPTYYHARDAFERDGLVGLLPDKKGPKRAHKLTPEVLTFVKCQLEEDSELKPSELAQRILDVFGITVHPKSIIRALRRSKTEARGPPMELVRNTADVEDLYEQMRRGITQGEANPRDGLAVIRQQGLHAWIDLVTSNLTDYPRTRVTPGPKTQEEMVAAHLATMATDSAPLISLCAEMLMSKLTSKTTQEEI